MDLVLTAVLLLAVAAVIMYRLVVVAEKLIHRLWGVSV